MRFKKSKVRRAARVDAPLRDHFSIRLTGYAAMASAAGVGLLAAAAPAKAEIVYTPADHTLKTGSAFHLDLNHDGTNDFLFLDEADLGLGSTTFLIVEGLNPGDKVLQVNKAASALPFGARIGPAQNFSHSASMAFAYNHSIGGPWANAKNRYLGLEFRLDGQEHFGWAEFSVRQGQGSGIEARLEGYAYDTVANQAILAGQKASAEAFLHPGTLGLLARGSLGLDIWRRKKQEV